MTYQWIMDVLCDLREFAQRNGLTALAEQLKDTAQIAASEIDRTKDGAEGKGLHEVGRDGPFQRGWPQAARSDGAGKGSE
ncbi:MAG: hypothetical protein ORN49_13880 [Rhodobacteraceae bacterium]|nr:hypothetical protein [Paracoccaceae bacterium]